MSHDPTAVPGAAEADAALIAADPGLPGLRLLLDAAAFAAAVGAEAAEPLYLRYKPGESCLAGFRLDGGREVSAKAVTAGRWATVAANPKWGPPRLPDGGLPRRLDAERILLRARREDPGLRALARLDDPEKAAKTLRRLLGKPGPLRLVALRWKAERRFVARIDGPEGPLAVLKISNGADYPRALAGAGVARAAGGPRLMGASTPLRAFAARWAGACRSARRRRGASISTGSRRRGARWRRSTPRRCGWSGTGRASRPGRRSPPSPPCSGGCCPTWQARPAISRPASPRHSTPRRRGRG
jgi:hypothetical protein